MRRAPGQCAPSQGRRAVRAIAGPGGGARHSSGGRRGQWRSHRGANGATVVIFGRGKQALDEAVSELGLNSFAVQGDVCKLADIDKLFSETKSKFGGVDILFVNAAQAKLAAIADTTETFFDENYTISGAMAK